MRKITRKVGESIVLDGDRRITILRIEGHRAWLGVSGPEGEGRRGERRDAPRTPLIAGAFLADDG